MGCLDVATVLVVEDHQDTLDMMLKIIRIFGHHALGAETGEAALAILCSQGPDIIIVDGMMPGMTGSEFIRLCRANPQTASIPIILQTAQTSKQFSDEAIGNGANEVWHKGQVHINHMRERLQHYLSRQPGQAN